MPSTATDRIYALSSTVAIKAPVRVATTAAITLSALQTIDGVALAVGDRVLVKNQADPTQNGIYVAATTSWSRDQDFDGARDVVNGTVVRVTSGTTSANLWYGLTTADPIVIGTSSITFAVTGVPVSVSSAMIPVVQGATLAAARSAMGLGTSATVDSGTSGAKVPLLNGANTWSGTQTLSGAALNFAANGLIAAATTTDLSSVASNDIYLTGGSPVTITSWGSLPAGATRRVRNAGSAVFTVQQNGNTNNRGGVDIPLQLNDTCVVRGLGGGVAIMDEYDGQGSLAPAQTATKATQQAGTDTARAVVASQQQQHPSAAKAYGLVAAGGTTVVGSYPAGATSVRNSIGNYTITLGVTMASTNYVCVVTPESAAGTQSGHRIVSRTTTTVTVELFAATIAADVAGHYAVFGQLA